TYSTTYAATKSAGQYRVDAVAPDGKGRATTTFKVAAAAEIPAAVADEADKLIAAVDKAIAAARDGLAAQPLSPAKQQAEQRIATASSEVAKAPPQIKILRQEMTKVFTARANVTEPLPDWDEYEKQLDKLQDEAEVARKRLEEQAAATRA